MCVCVCVCVGGGGGGIPPWVREAFILVRVSSLFLVFPGSGFLPSM